MRSAWHVLYDYIVSFFVLEYIYGILFVKSDVMVGHALNYQGGGNLIPQSHVLPPHFSLGFSHFIMFRLWRKRDQSQLENLALGSFIFLQSPTLV
jgi:hypothetical protein